MAGQPLSKFSSGVGLQFGPGSLAKRPVLGHLVMFVIEQWSMTEMQLLLILRHCLGGDPTVAADMLAAIDNQTIQRTVIMTATRAVLPEEDWAVVEHAFASMTASRQVRNRFAHHIWGIAADMPEALLLLDPKTMAIELSRELKRHAIARKEHGETMKPKAVDEILDRSQITVWRKNDLLAEGDASSRAGTITQQIISLIYATRNKKPVDSIRQSLMDEPTIQERIQSQKRRTSPKSAR